MLTKYLWVLFISMVPIVELRGAIPAGCAMGLNIYAVCILSIIGNLIPVPIIFFFARKFLLWGQDKKFIGGICRFFLKKGDAGGKKLEAKAGKGLFIALMIFVGIPLPGTGAWTGTLAASVLNMDFKKTILAVSCGVLIAGTIVGLICGGVLTAFEFLL